MIVARIAGLWVFSTVFVCALFGQTPTATVEIQFTGHGGGFWGRYAVCYGKSRIAGGASPPIGETNRIEGIFSGPKTRIRGVLYAPGCALQTMDISVKESRLYQYAFRCDPLPQTEIQGATGPVDPLHRGHHMKIEAEYAALWTAEFLGYDDGTTSEIPLAGDSAVDEQGHFRLSIPDFAKDKVAGSPNHAAEIRIWARDQDDGRVFANLRLLSGKNKLQPTRFGGIPVDSIGSSLLEFTTCYADPPAEHDRFGFTIRSELKNDCAY
jgi:hypothetical protein